MHNLYVCNWKMFVDCALIDSFLKAYAAEALNMHQNTTIVVCPSFCFLGYTNDQQKVITQNSIKIGAQDCSQFATGAYTGEIAAQHLKQVGCLYTIVGHVERRKFFHENDEIVLAKATHLLCAGITPIICIGPFEGIFNVLDICMYVKKQVTFFMRNLDKNSTVIFAYEPHQAIGAGEIPSIHAIAEIFSYIKTAAYTFNPEAKQLIMYGGSVDEHSIKTLKTIRGIDGFLVGRASIDFQKLKNIISY